MHLYLLADVRSTEAWGLGHLAGVVVVVALIVLVVNGIRVRRRR